MTSIEQSRRALEIVTKAFQITKNIPLDYRFIISSLSNLDTEIPLRYRYNGLIFFVVDQKVNDGTTLNNGERKTNGTINVGPTTGTNQLSGILYVFESDLTKPIPLHDTMLRFIIRQLTGYNNNWTNLVTDLNHTHAKAGSIVYVEDLGISVIFNGTDWKYFSGIFTIGTEESWSTVPAQFKVQNTYVFIGTNTTLNSGIRKIILSDGTLSDEILVVTDSPAKVENNRYYLVNGYLYYSINGTLYLIGDKLIIIAAKQLINEDNVITHNFNTQSLIYGYCKISTVINNHYSNNIFPIELIMINPNQVNIKSSVAIDNCTIFLISKI